MAYVPHPDAKSEITKLYEGYKQLGMFQAVLKPVAELPPVELENATDLDTVWSAPRDV